MENLQKAVSLGLQNISVYYNYGLLVQQQGKLSEAEQVLKKRFALQHQAANINYALAYLYATQESKEQARVHADVLCRVDPNNPAYRGRFQSLGY
jgi:Flp pilus assembly protein TadD